MDYAEGDQQQNRKVVVSTKGLVKVFGDQRALDGVDLELLSGTVTALVGENGSGKSTIIKCLTGVYQPEKRDQLTWSEGMGSRSCVAVHQDLGLVPGLTIAENFGITNGFMRGFFGRISWRRHNRHVASILHAAGVRINPKSNVDELSVAEKTMVAIARTLAGASDGVRLVILDEPTAALPLDDRGEVLATVRRLAASGMAVLYVSHHLEEIVKVADHIVVLRSGSIAHSLPNRDLTADSLLHLMSDVSHSTPVGSERTFGDVVLKVTDLQTALLKSLNFELRRGEILGFLGAPDSGGSDVCRALTGLLGYAGEVEVSGRRVTPGSVLASVKRGVYLVPSDRRGRGIIGELSVADNLAIASMRRRFVLAPLSPKKTKASVLAMMEQMEIRPRIPSRKLGLLSGGNQQKVVLARALDQRPTVLILENPTQGVDPAARLHIRENIRKAAAQGTSIIISSVDDTEIYAVADRVLEFTNGVAA